MYVIVSTEGKEKGAFSVINELDEKVILFFEDFVLGEQISII